MMAFITGLISFVLIMFMRPKVSKQKDRASDELERGRSKVSKDLRPEEHLGHVPDII